MRECAVHSINLNPSAIYWPGDQDLVLKARSVSKWFESWLFIVAILELFMHAKRELNIIQNVALLPLQVHEIILDSSVINCCKLFIIMLVDMVKEAHTNIY